MTKNKPLNLREFWDQIGTANMTVIINELGSSLKYFRALRYGNKRPSGELALRIIEQARKHTAPFEPDLALLLAGVPRANKPNEPLPPSAEFVRTRKRYLKKTQEGAEA